MPERMSEDMPQKMSEDMPNRLPERYARKNVRIYRWQIGMILFLTVGITRSKIFSFFRGIKCIYIYIYNHDQP